MTYGVANSLAFCWPSGSTEWTPIGDRLYWDHRTGCRVARSYQDFVYSNTRKHFFCITQWGVFESWDLRNPWSARMDWLDEEKLRSMYYFDDEIYPRVARSEEELKRLRSCSRTPYLVFSEQSNQLFLVVRYIKTRLTLESYPYTTMGFDVHKIDPEEGGGGKLSHMECGSLDGLTMFVGLNHSFAVLAAEFSELKPNSIYFTDDHEKTPPKWDVDSIYGGHDIGIFDYQNRTISPCYYPCDVQSF